MPTLDESFMAPRFRGDQQIFYATTSTTLQGWQQWHKPRGATMVWMVGIGGGGGGGGAQSGSTSTARGGGGGGGSSGLARLLVPAMLIPDTLYVQVGAGGLGGTSAGAGASGVLSYVVAFPVTGAPNALNMLLVSGNVAAGGGAAGAASAAGGAAGTIAQTQSQDAFGWWFAIAGQIGAASGAAGAAGVATSAWATMFTSGGGGGASTTTTTTEFAGGAITAGAAIDNANGLHFASSGTVSPGGTTAGGAGQPGFNRLSPFITSGGSGGGSSDAGTGGTGGLGGYGSGGGGGGPGGTGGNGGRGGDGLVIIGAF